MMQLGNQSTINNMLEEWKVTEKEYSVKLQQNDVHQAAEKLEKT